MCSDTGSDNAGTAVFAYSGSSAFIYNLHIYVHVRHSCICTCVTSVSICNVICTIQLVSIKDHN